MYFSALLALLPLAAYAKQIPIDVGEGGLVFNPPNVNASQGDQLVFTFYPQNHSVTQSTFSAPCQQSQGGFSSGFVPVSAGSQGGTFTVTVNDTNPIWIFCAQTKGTHCQAGMSMAVNAPATDKTLQAYQAASKSATTSVNSGLQGGTLSVNGTSGGGSGSNSTSPTTGGSGPTPTASQGSSSGSSASSSAAAAPTGVAGWSVLGGAAVLGGLLI